jgi:hypothetical protein
MTGAAPSFNLQLTLMPRDEARGGYNGRCCLSTERRRSRSPCPHPPDDPSGRCRLSSSDRHIPLSNRSSIFKFRHGFFAPEFRLTRSVPRFWLTYRCKYGNRLLGVVILDANSITEARTRVAVEGIDGGGGIPGGPTARSGHRQAGAEADGSVEKGQGACARAR